MVMQSSKPQTKMCQCNPEAADEEPKDVHEHVKAAPPSCGLSTTCEPNGHNARIPKRIVAMPKGMPMMVIISNSEETKYSTAMPNPPKMSQMMFPNIFMSVILVSNDECFYLQR
jgi:hypothetical protein